MEWFFVGVFTVIAVMYAISRLGKSTIDTSYMEQQIEAMDTEPTIEDIKVEWFNQLYKLTWYREEDQTEGFYIQDKKTHAILGYVDAENNVRQIKQQQEKK